MRPSVSQLSGWRPGELSGAGEDLLRRAHTLQSTAGDLTGVRGGLAGVWSGAAADAATGHTDRRAGETDLLAATVQTAGRALVTAGDALGQAQAVLRAAVQAAHASGCTVTDDGSVLPPARPPVPGGLPSEDLTVWQQQADAIAVAQAAGAARLAQQITTALTAAGAADDVAASALGSLRAPGISPAPRPVTMGLSGGDWGDWGAAPAAAPAPAGHQHWWDSVGSAVGDAAGRAWTACGTPGTSCGARPPTRSRTRRT